MNSEKNKTVCFTQLGNKMREKVICFVQKNIVEIYHQFTHGIRNVCLNKFGDPLPIFICPLMFVAKSFHYNII